MMKKTLGLSLLLLWSVIIFANENNGTAGKKGDIIGIVIDASDKRPVEYATLALYRESDDKLISGGISDSEGFFRLKNNPAGKYYLTITFMGYKPYKTASIEITEDTKEYDLDKIAIDPNVKELEGVDVVADQSAIQYRIDKKIVNVSQQLTAKSGSAVDILENVPSVKVDIDGNVSLRGSTSFTVLIDGRPTVLDPSDALSQIPAGAIENIEIITNPSAKYEPDGTSGIINIVTKKNKLDGITGIVNASVGLESKYGGDATLDFRKKNIHLYFGADYNQRTNPGDINYKRWTILNEDSTRYLNADGEFERNRTTGSLKGGIDWDFTKHDVIGVGVRTGMRNMERGSALDYEESYNSELPKYYSTNQLGLWDGTFYSLSFDYKHTFANNKKHTIEIQAIIDGRDMDENSKTESDTNGFVYDGTKATETGPSRGYRYKLDYTLPLSSGDKIEAGGQAQISADQDDNRVYKFNTSSRDYIFQDTFSYITNYTRNTYAIYGMYGGERGNFGYQGGLRMEYTHRFLELTKTNEEFSIDRPDFFPTLHFSYKLPAEQELMVSYTRRIERPRGYQLEPFYTWMDANNMRKGNPDLLPEYVNSFDLGYQKKMGENFIALEGYYRITQNKSERVMTVYEPEPKINLHTFENVGTDYALGVELTFNYNPTKWYTTNLMGDIFDYRLVGELYDTKYDQHEFSWNARFNNTFKITSNTRFQIDLSYNSDRIQAQGTEDGFFSANAAVKQDLFKRKISATLQVRDIFGTSLHASTTRGANFEQRTEFKPNTPIVMLTLSYKINNYRMKRNVTNEGGGDTDDGGGF